jgi:hypothetical protein
LNCWVCRVTLFSLDCVDECWHYSVSAKHDKNAGGCLLVPIVSVRGICGVKWPNRTTVTRR